MIALLWLLACGGLGDQAPAYTGTIEVTEVEVASSLPGRLLEVRFDEGDTVSPGDAVFTLDAEVAEAERDLRTSAVDVARAGVESGTQAAKASKAQVTYLTGEVERLRKMEKAGVGSSQQRAALEGQLAVARAQSSAANAAIAQAQSGVAQAQTAVLVADKRLEELRVAATVGGVVLSRNREPGEVVGPGTSVLTLGDLSRPRLRIYVPLLTVQTLSVGDRVLVRIDASEVPIEGKVERVANQAEFTPRDILTPEERVKRVFAVDIGLPPGPGLLPGVPAEAELGS
jgi:HlyD family secretion protein